MNRYILFIILSFWLLVFLLWANGASAQTSYPLSTTKLSWQWVKGAQAGINDAIPTEFRVKCGTQSKTYTIVTSVPYVVSPTNQFNTLVSGVTKGPNTYYCVVTAYVSAGVESAPTNEVFFAAFVDVSGPTNATVGP